MRVRIPGPLRSYTSEAAVVSADGTTLAQVLDDLDRQFPGMRFRVIDEHGGIRRHIRFFVDASSVPDIQADISGGSELMIVCALSGG
jgi:sulfur-carrier protein